MGEWIFVKDRLPEHFTRVLVFRAGKHSLNTDGIFTAWLVQHPDMFRNHEAWVLAGTRNDCISGVTHWQPLPAPPSD